MGLNKIRAKVRTTAMVAGIGSLLEKGRVSNHMGRHTGRDNGGVKEDRRVQ